MALEALLPSEVARLVYGYLVTEKCTETAKTFLDESPNLYECRSVLQRGRTFTTRVCGLALLDILEKFCTVNSIVQEQLTIFDNTHKIKYCRDIISQIKFLLEEYKSQPAASTSDEPIQDGQTTASQTQTKSYRNCYIGKNQSQSNVATQSDDGYQTETPPESISTQNSTSIEATRLENLPGYIETFPTKICELSQSKPAKTPTKITKANKVQQKEQVKSSVRSQEVQTSMRIPEQDILMLSKTNENSIQVPNENESQVERSVKSLNIGITATLDGKKLSQNIDSKVPTFEIDLCNKLKTYTTDKDKEVLDVDDSEASLESPISIDPGTKVSEACIEILEDLQTELLSRSEIHEKIASNINKLMTPINNGSLSKHSNGSDEQGSRLFVAELDKMVEKAVNMTENDPMFIELLNSIIKLDEYVSSSEEIEMDVDHAEENKDALIEGKNNQRHPEVVNINSMNISPVAKNIQCVTNSGMDNDVVAIQNTRIFKPDTTTKTDLVKQSTQTVPSNTPIIAVTPPDFFQENNKITSTPLKLFIATQNYDTNPWFSTQALLSPNVIALRENVHPFVLPYAETATEAIVNPVDGFISPIVCKENSKVAEKISCSVANTKKDDVLHTPDVPPVTKSFIPTGVAAISAVNVLPKEKSPVLPKTLNGENISPNVQIVHKMPSFSGISALVKDTEFNRYFSIDSISVVNMDNTANTNVQNPSTIPEIEVEDSIGLTGTGLSPFFKKSEKIESQKNENTTLVKMIDTGSFSNEKLDRTSAIVENVAKENELLQKALEANSVAKNDQQLTYPAEIAVHGANKTVQVLTIDCMKNGIRVNENSAVANETVQRIDTKVGENTDLTSKAVSNELVNEIDGKMKKNIEVIFNTLSNKIIETNEAETQNSQICEEGNTVTKNVSTLKQQEAAKYEETKVQGVNSNKESLKSFINKTFESYIDSSKDNMSNQSNETITRNTPKALVEERAKRRSLSTPKKSSTHIRALTFETPIQPQSDSKIHDKTRNLSPETVKRNLKSFHESFQSPPLVDPQLSGETQDTNMQEKISDEITMDAVNKLSCTTTNQDPKKPKETKKENAGAKIWDSDLRSLLNLDQPNQIPEQSKKEGPKRKYKTKSREEVSSKKKKRDKSKTPRKEKKSGKTPHKKSKKSENEKTIKKSKKHDNSREHRDHIKNAIIEKNTKIEDNFSEKEFEDISALIENNLMSKMNNEVLHEVENEKRIEDDFSAISSRIENNLMSRKDSKVMHKIKTKTVSYKSKKLPSKEDETKKSHNKVKNKVDKHSNISASRKEPMNNLISNNNKEKMHNGEKKEMNRKLSPADTVAKENLSEEVSKTNIKTASTKDSLVYLLSDSVNDDEVFNDIMELEPNGKTSHKELAEDNKELDIDIVQKMEHDEKAIAAVLEETNDVNHQKCESKDLVSREQDFFPDTSLMTEADADSEPEEIEKLGGTVLSFKEMNNLQPDSENDQRLQENEKNIEEKKQVDKTLTTLSTSRPSTDYKIIEKQLSILTKTKVSSTRKVIYDQVSKVEDGKVVKKKYARLQTLNTKVAMENKLISMGGYEIILDTPSSIKEDDSMDIPPTPKIASPNSNSWVPNPLIKEDSRTIHSSIPTPLECPPTPTIFVTPQKIEEETARTVAPQLNIAGIVTSMPYNTGAVPFYHLTPITFDTPLKSEGGNQRYIINPPKIVNTLEHTKQPEITEFEVVKETLLKSSTPKTPVEQKDEKPEEIKIKSGSVSLSLGDQSRSRLDTEDSDSSSSSSSSSSSMSDDDDSHNHSGHPSESKKAEKAKPALEENIEPVRMECNVNIQNEEFMADNEMILIDHEEIVVAQESSPMKVFSINKTDKELEETIKETPAKDENMIPEEGIFETPNVTKPLNNPTNLHAKISQMMILKEQEEMRRLESQEKPKIISIERMSPKIDVQNLTHSNKTLPENLQSTALKSKTNQIKSKLVQKSEEEVAKAIESISNNGQLDEKPDDVNTNVASSTVPEILNNSPQKRELVKAIQSITNDVEADKSRDSFSDKGSSDSDIESNLQLVLDDDDKPQEPALVDEDSMEETFGFDNNDVQQAEIHIIFDQTKYKKRRRKQFEDDEMTLMPEDEDGKKIATFAPTLLDILFHHQPTKRKTGPKKKTKQEVPMEDDKYDDGDSSEDFVPVKNRRGGTKRRRSGDEPKSRKRSKNIFIY